MSSPSSAVSACCTPSAPTSARSTAALASGGLPAAGVVHRGAATASFAVELVALTAAAAASTAWLVVALRTGRAPGLAERAALAAFALWELSTAARLARAARSPGRRSTG